METAKNLVIWCFWFGVLAAFLSGEANAVPVQWSGNGHWYEAVHVPAGISWTDARDAAPSILPGGYLASINSEAENEFVFSLIDDDAFWFHDPGGGSFGPWLGGTDEVTEGVWQWVSGESWGYTNWHPGQPDDWAGSEDYLDFYVNSPTARASTWNDLADWPLSPITAITGYVVETPEPGTLLLLGLGVVGVAGLGRRRRR
jgi:hypothetical protein